MANPPVCSIPDCGKPAFKRGFCRPHYYPMRGGPVCSIDGCNQPARARGWCNAHWRRWSRHGDPTKGNKSHGELPTFLSETVLPFSGDECLIWPYGKDGHGYGMLSGKPVNRLVCKAIHGPAPTSKHQAAHSCGNGHLGCCNPQHLRWATRSENESDKIDHDTHHRGTRHPQAKLDESDVRQIRSLAGVELLGTTAARFGIAPSTVCGIQKRNRWAWLE